jgi:hypothetical protein
MNNHKKYKLIENDIEYNVLEFISDDKKDNITINKFVNNNKYCKTIERYYSYYISDIDNWHPYYNCGVPISKIIYYCDGEISEEYEI